MFFRKPTSALALGILLAASVVVLGTALLSQYVGGLQPCVLCLYQRVPYGVVIVLTALVLAWEFYGNSLAPGVARGTLLVSAWVFFAGACIAGFHVGVEQGWWQGTDGCAGPDLNALSLEELKQQLLASPVVRCDEVAWSLFGISMAGYNLMVSILLAGICIWFAASFGRRRGRNFAA